RRKTTATKVTAGLNAHLQNPVSNRTVRRELHKQHIHGRATIAKPLVSLMNMKRRLQWCQEHKTWTAEQWKHVLFSDESMFTLFPTTGCVYVWRTPAEAYNPRLPPSSSEAWGRFHNGLGHDLALYSRFHYHLTRMDQ
ncbi:hypothetical protein JGF61_23265, partial [Salmonella enterica subsp. enterica serovar Agona]|nr:hypothetical protein [Salmonella enterica subsp. enterica serovar Agona]